MCFQSILKHIRTTIERFLKNIVSHVIRIHKDKVFHSSDPFDVFNTNQKFTYSISYSWNRNRQRKHLVGENTRHSFTFHRCSPFNLFDEFGYSLFQDDLELFLFIFLTSFWIILTPYSLYNCCQNTICIYLISLYVFLNMLSKTSTSLKILLPSLKIVPIRHCLNQLQSTHKEPLDDRLGILSITFLILFTTWS